jgi:hypothetical protein
VERTDGCLVIILWHVDSLIGNDREIGSYTTGAHTTMEKLLEAVFSMRLLPRLYDEEQLRLQQNLGPVVRRVGVWCEMATSPGLSCDTVAAE